MPTVREIEQALFDLAPKDGAMVWDNVGQLLGDPEQAVEKVLVALDITEAVADEAIAQRFAQYKASLAQKIVKANAELSEVKYQFKTN